MISRKVPGIKILPATVDQQRRNSCLSSDAAAAAGAAVSPMQQT
jgi:hypothetical protein